MNVYDFDGTIYDGDSTVDFYLYCLRRQPMLVRYLPRQVLGGCAYLVGGASKTTFKERFLIFLRGVRDLEETVLQFWSSHEEKIYSWYLERQKPDDVVISASPEFLLAPICKRLRVGALIASEVDGSTGAFLSPNNRGEEKVLRFRARFERAVIDEFYSDSLSDGPLARISRRPFLVHKGIPSAWDLQDLRVSDSPTQGNEGWLHEVPSQRDS